MSANRAVIIAAIIGAVAAILAALITVLLSGAGQSNACTSDHSSRTTCINSLQGSGSSAMLVAAAFDRGAETDLQ